MVAGAIVCVSCGDVPPCKGVRQGDEVTITLYEPSETGSAPRDAGAACASEWGFSEGVEIGGKITGLTGEFQCLAGVFEVEGVDGWEWEHSPGGGDRLAGVALYATHDVRMGRCVGFVRFLVDAEGLDCDAQTGPKDECELEVSMTPKAGRVEHCPAACFGDFPVKVVRQ
jgi:hypothetical protein